MGDFDRRVNTKRRTTHQVRASSGALQGLASNIQHWEHQKIPCMNKVLYGFSAIKYGRRGGPHAR